MDRTLFRTLTEKQRKIFLGQEAISRGWGGITSVSQEFGVARSTVSEAVKMVRNGETYIPELGQRRKGGGRKPITETCPELEGIVISIAKRSSYGSPTDDRTWTTMSSGKIVKILKEEYGITTCSTTVLKILRKNRFSRQQNQKMIQVGKPDPNRDEQFKFIKKEREEFAESGDPILSCDTKKKNLSATSKIQEASGENPETHER